MFGGGWTEMLIIGVVALIVIGPKDLPIVMRKVGRMVGTVRRMGTEFQRELNTATGLDQITDLRRQITEPLRQTRDEIVGEFNKITTTGVEPSGIVKPADPKVESVYETIAANSSVEPEATPVMPSGSAEPSPAPVEATLPEAAEPPAKPKRTPRAKTTAGAAKPRSTKAVSAKTAAAKTAAPRAKAAKAEAAMSQPRVRSAAAKASVERIAKAPAAPKTPRVRKPDLNG